MSWRLSRMSVRIKLGLLFFAVFAGFMAAGEIASRYTDSPAARQAAFGLAVIVYFLLARYMLRKSAHQLAERAGEDRASP